MGDALSLMPSVRYLQDAFPHAHIDWLTTNRCQPSLFEKLRFIHKIYRIPTSFFSATIFLASFLFKCRKYDLVIDYDQYYRVSEFVSNFGKVNVGFKTNLKGNTFLMAESYDPLKNEKYQFRDLTALVINKYHNNSSYFNINLPELIQNFKPNDYLLKLLKAAKSKGRPLVIVYPGSSLNAKFRRWDHSKFQKIIDFLRIDFTVIIAGGKDEADIKNFFRKDSYVYNWIGLLNLNEWSWVFGKHIFFAVANDGGLFHLLESQLVPIVGIFGPSLYEKWGSVNSTSIAVHKPIECRPCLKNYLGIVPHSCARGDLACLESISIDDVKEAISNLASKITVTKNK